MTIRATVVAGGRLSWPSPTSRRRPPRTGVRRATKHGGARALTPGPALLVAIVLVTWGCAPVSARRQEVYKELEGARGGNRSPIVIVPGILGSVLEKHDPGRPDRRRPVWGGLSPLFSHNFDEMELAVDAESEAGLLAQRDVSGEVYSKRILGRVTLPWYLRIPARLFGVAQGEYDLLTERLLDLGYREATLGFEDQAYPDVVTGRVCPGDNLFVFDYDWRRDIPTLAGRLELFVEAVVEATKASKEGGVALMCVREAGRPRCEPPKRVDCPDRPPAGRIFDPARWDGRVHLLAHSMGGLIAKYYFAFGGQPIPERDDAPGFDERPGERVDSLFLIGTPSRGSLAVFRYAVEGYDDFPFGLFVDRSASWRVLSTMPSVYQLMPFGGYEFIVTDGEPVHVRELYRRETWKRFGWGIYNPRFAAAVARAGHAQWERFLEVVLRRAQRVHAALWLAEGELRGRGLVKRIYLIGGDCLPTPIAGRVERGETRFPDYEEVREPVLRAQLFFPGDGRVTVRSLMELDSPAHPVLAWNAPVFHCQRHGDLYKDDGVQDFLLTILHRLKGRRPDVTE